jgi:A/G-specific adenine glycosylase
MSEIIMQQTRIEQGAPYYLRFIKRFPDLASLAEAQIDEVLRYWQGLGYYSRARNLHKAAQYLMESCGGHFPTDYEGLLKMPGVGPYSAAAIASFAYGLPHPVVDGNVKRVIARYSGITSSIDDASVHEQIRKVAESFMSGADPGTFNQALMNFGAVVCKPKGADCLACPMSKKCFAFKHDMVSSLPVRSKKKTNRIRYFHFIVLQWRGRMLLVRRNENDIWKGLYTPPMVERETDRNLSMKSLLPAIERIVGHRDVSFTHASEPQQQLLSHQTIHGRFHYFKLNQAALVKHENEAWVNAKTIRDYAKPRMVVEEMENTKF